MTVQSKVETATLASAMAGAFAEIEAASKDATNPHFKSKYADLTSVIGAIKTPLINHNLWFEQHCHPSEEGVLVETFVGHAGGEKQSMGKLFVPANKKDAQGFGSALTYARRYALQTAFGVPTEDDDGNAASRSAPARNGHTDAPKQITDDQRDIIQALAPAAGKAVQDICKAYRIDSLKGLSESQAAKLIERLQTDKKEPVNA